MWLKTQNRLINMNNVYSVGVTNRPNARVPDAAFHVVEVWANQESGEIFRDKDEKVCKRFVAEIERALIREALVFDVSDFDPKEES